MTWREEIAERAQNGDAEGVLRVFDELWTDRERVRQQNVAYLEQIAELKSGKPAGRKEVGVRVESHEALEKGFKQLTVALKQYAASL